MDTIENSFVTLSLVMDILFSNSFVFPVLVNMAIEFVTGTNVFS